MALKSNIPKLRAALIDRALIGAERGATYIVDLAKQLVPVDTTRLQQSIRVEREGETIVVIAGGIVVDGEPVDYAAFVEYGTSVSPAQPFMTPAVNNIDVRKEVVDEINQLIRESGV